MKMFTPTHYTLYSLTSLLVLLSSHCPISGEECPFELNIDYDGDNLEIPLRDEVQEVILKQNQTKISCSSRLPIEFKFDGLLSNRLLSSETIRDADLDNWNVTERFCFRIYITVQRSNNATGLYSCSTVAGFGNQSRAIYLYSEGETNHSVVGGGINQIVSIPVSSKERNIRIPCRVTQPNVSVTLYKIINWRKFLTPYKHNPREGFLLAFGNLSYVLGRYVCRNFYDEKDYLEFNVFIDEPNETTIKNIPVIHNQDSRFVCYSSSNDNVTLTYEKCLTPLDCNMRSVNHFRNPTKIMHRPKSDKAKNGNSVEMKLTRRESAGFLQCYSGGNKMATKTVYFHTTLNGKLVMNDKDETTFSDELQLIPDAITFNQVRLENGSWEGERIYVTCRTSKFKFSKGSRWAVLKKNSTTVNADFQSWQPELSKDTESYYSSTRRISISQVRADLVAIICLAPVLNSIEWATISLPISTLNITGPRFFSPRNETIVLGEGDKRKIDCNATRSRVAVLKRDRIIENKTEFIEIPTPKINKIPYYYIEDKDRLEGDSATFVCNISNEHIGVVNLKFFFVTWRKPVSPFQWIVVTVSIVLIFFVLIALLLYKKYHAGQSKEAGPRLGKDYVNRIRKQLKENVIPLKVPEQCRIIGKGHYGTVFEVGDYAAKGIAWHPRRCPKNVEIFKLFIKEMELIAKLGDHQNLVQFKGVVIENIEKFEAFIVFEKCALGDLKKYLRQNKTNFNDQRIIPGYSRWSTGNQRSTPTETPVERAASVNTTDLIKIAIQIACGMEYLGEKNMVHRDLAARNVLLTVDKIAKITDFGLCRRIPDEKDYYKLIDTDNEFPWPWLAPEIYDSKKFSVNSDIWAFGITLWEMFSLDDEPYDKCLSYCSGANIRHFLIDQRQRLSRPRYADEVIYLIMMECWHPHADARPRFSVLQDRLNTRLEFYLETSPSPPQSPPQSSDSRSFSFDSCSTQRTSVTSYGGFDDMA